MSTFALFSTDTFKLDACRSINYNDEHDRVALIAVLTLRSTEKHVLVANTHLWWNASYVTIEESHGT